MASCDSLKMEPPTAQLPESCQNPTHPNPQQPPKKIEIDLDDDCSDARKVERMGMELRSGKNLLAFTTGTKLFARPKPVKRKRSNLYAPCSHCNKNPAPPPRVDFWARIGYGIIEEEQPANCGCPGEELVKVYRFIHKGRKQRKLMY